MLDKHSAYDFPSAYSILRLDFFAGVDFVFVEKGGGDGVEGVEEERVDPVDEERGDDGENGV